MQGNVKDGGMSVYRGKRLGCGKGKKMVLANEKG